MQRSHSRAADTRKTSSSHKSPADRWRSPPPKSKWEQQEAKPLSRWWQRSITPMKSIRNARAGLLIREPAPCRPHGWYSMSQPTAARRNGKAGLRFAAGDALKPWRSIRRERHLRSCWRRTNTRYRPQARRSRSRSTAMSISPYRFLRPPAGSRRREHVHSRPIRNTLRSRPIPRPRPVRPRLRSRIRLIIWLKKLS